MRGQAPVAELLAGGSVARFGKFARYCTMPKSHRTDQCIMDMLYAKHNNDDLQDALESPRLDGGLTCQW